MQQQEDQQNIQIHMCITNNRELPKYTNPHVYKQQKDYQNIQIHMCITNNRKVQKYTNPNYMHRKQKDQQKLQIRMCTDSFNYMYTKHIPSIFLYLYGYINHATLNMI